MSQLVKLHDDKIVSFIKGAREQRRQAESSRFSVPWKSRISSRKHQRQEHQFLNSHVSEVHVFRGSLARTPPPLPPLLDYLPPTHPPLLTPFSSVAHSPSLLLSHTPPLLGIPTSPTHAFSFLVLFFSLPAHSLLIPHFPPLFPPLFPPYS